MAERLMITRTTTALLADLVDPDNEDVWHSFDDRFRPILVGFGRRLGLGAEDAADAAQDALVRFVGEYRAGRYDRERGRLSSWLLGIARHCILDQARDSARRRVRRGLSAVADAPAEDRWPALWAEACEGEILRRALEALRTETRAEPRTIRAFELVVVHRRPPADVAAEMDMTLNDVYLAKHRCLEHMRGIVARLEAVYELDEPEPAG